MASMNLFNQLPDSEKEDFSAACLKLGLHHEAFEVRMKEEYQSVGVAPILREAAVVRLSNGKSKRYPAGNGQAWIVAFEDDLFSLYFE